MDCNCVSDLLLPPVPALWTPGPSHHHAYSRAIVTLLHHAYADIIKLIYVPKPANSVAMNTTLITKIIAIHIKVYFQINQMQAYW